MLLYTVNLYITHYTYTLHTLEHVLVLVVVFVLVLVSIRISTIARVQSAAVQTFALLIN